MPKPRNPKPGTSCEDHLGNKYPSINALCRAYGITAMMYEYRLKKKNWSLEDTLTKPAADTTLGGAGKCRDHLDNEFDSVKDMCDYYRIPRTTYHYRIRSGWTVERALTEPIKKTRYKAPVRDPNGIEYVSIDKMCEAWDISKRDFITNLKNNLSLERALTERTTLPEHPKDHLGNIYPSFNKMLEHYGVSKSKLRSRLELGWTLEKILTTPENMPRGKKTRDAEGAEYSTQKEMLEKYGVAAHSYKYREKKGFSKAECLSPESLHSKRSVDHHGDVFDCLQDMLEWWSRLTGSYHKLLDKDEPIEKCLLGTEARRSLPLPDGVKIKAVIGAYYLVSRDGIETMIPDVTLHRRIRKMRADAYLSENGNALPDGRTVKIIDNYYEISDGAHSVMVDSDALFKLIFFSRHGKRREGRIGNRSERRF